MDGLLEQAVAWVQAHAAWTGPVVFLASFVESLALVGIVFPGAALMFAAGALAGLGAIPLGPTLAWAALGAVTGDAASYWLGRRYGEALTRRWPLSRHPELVARGRSFFARHGGKSVLLGRFVGPLRPVIPAVAGMLGMGAGRFLAMDALAALGWAPAYVLPGTVFAASLTVAAEVAARLAVLVVVLMVLLWLGVWAVRRLTLALQPHAEALLARLARWSRAHRWLGEPGAALADPTHPEFRGLALLALALAVGAWGFAAALAAATPAGEPVTGLDRAVHDLLQGLRTPWADRLMAALTLPGDVRVWGAVALAVGALLALRRAGKALAHWAGAVAGAWALTHALKALTAVPRPLGEPTGPFGHAFPSGHVTLSATVYGLTAVLLARELAPPRRWLAYAAAAALVLPVALSRLYLGAHWLTDVLGGLALGVAWVAAVGIAYRRHRPARLPAGALAAVAGGTLALAWAWNLPARVEAELARWHPPPPPVRALTAPAWRAGAWRTLPAARVDLAGRPAQPLNLQWAAALAEVDAALAAGGWRAPRRLTPGEALRYLQPEAPLADLPLPPQAHAGRHEALVRILAEADSGTVWVLRLWPAPVRVDGLPLWTGYVARLARRSPLGFFAYPTVDGAWDAALARLQASLPPPLAAGAMAVARPPPRPAGWSGRTLLVGGGS